MAHKRDHGEQSYRGSNRRSGKAALAGRRRSEHIRYHFNQEWTNPHLYHLMLCSSRGVERAAETILCAANLA